VRVNLSYQRLLSFAFLGALAMLGASIFLKGRLPERSDVLPEMLREPIQKETVEKPFSFSYKNETYNVRPKSSYELWGLVVSHNDINGLADIYHTASSVDTKDVCVIWGKNFDREYGRVKFWNGCWTCNWEYPDGVSVFADKISNNHLITADDAVRGAIGGIRVGDQIHLKGWLVDYEIPSQPGRSRFTSLTREDTGDGACEVVFVKEIEILKPGTPRWYTLYILSLRLLILIPLLKIALALILS
jgi:hypothetical protein